MERSNQNKLKHSRSNQIRGMIVSHKSPDRSSIGNVHNPHQYTLHGIQLSMSRKVQNPHANNHENSQSQHRHSKQVRDLSGSKELKQKNLRHKKNLKTTKKIGASGSHSKNKNSRQKSSSQNSQDIIQKNNIGKYGKIDEEYYSNAKIQLTQNRNKQHNQSNQKKKVKKVMSTDFLKTSDRLRTPKSKKKIEEEETNKLKFDSMKGVISFEGKLIKIKPFQQATKTKDNDASNQFFSEYISGQFASPYKKRISNSKQKKSQNRSFKSRKRLTNEKNENRSHPKQSSSQKDIKYRKQKKSKSNEHHRSNKSRKKHNETQKNSSKDKKTGYDVHTKGSKHQKGTLIRSTKDSRVNEEEQETLKYTEKKYERKQIIDFDELKKQIEEEKDRPEASIETFAKCIFKTKISKIKECVNQSSRVTVQESVGELIQEYDLRAKCINMISHISGSLGLKQNIFALAVSLFDHYSALMMIEKKQDLAKEDPKITEESSKSLTLSDQRKITALTCILLSLKLQNSEAASLFLNQLGFIFHKQKKQRDYQLPATHEFIIQKQEIQHERTSTHQIVVERRSGQKSTSKNRKRSKSRYTTTYSTATVNQKPNKKAQLQKKKRQFEQRKKQIIQAKFEGLYRILNEQIEGILNKDGILERQKQIYWKLNKKIYKKTYVYWIDSLTASWDQYILTLQTDTNSIKNSLSSYGQNISSFKNTNMCPKTPEFLMLFRSQYSPQKIWQVIQILESSLYYPQQFYSFNPAFLVLSTMYMLIRINLEYQQAQHPQGHNRSQKNHRNEEEILKIFENYRKLLVKSSNVLFVDNVNVNLLFGEYLMKLELQMGDILSCCQFISRFFYPSPLYFNKQSYERSFINQEHFQLIYGEQFQNKEKQGYSHYDERLSYHAHNPELYAFFGRTVTR